MLNNIITTLDIQTRPNDLDALSHVNNGVIFSYLETARFDFMNKNGIKENLNIVPVVARSNIHYLLEITIHDMIYVETEIINYERCVYKINFSQNIKSRLDADKIYVKSDIECAFIDKNSRTLCSASEFLNTAIAK